MQRIRIGYHIVVCEEPKGRRGIAAVSSRAKRSAYVGDALQVEPFRYQNI